MQDFNDYVNNNSENSYNNNNVFDMVKSLAKKFDGKNTSELIKAIYEQAKKGKQNGTLSNSDIDNFATFLMPMLDDKQTKILKKVISDLKSI